MFVLNKQPEVHSICINCFVEVSDSVLLVIPSESHVNYLTIVPFFFEWPIDNCSLKISRNYTRIFLLKGDVVGRGHISSRRIFKTIIHCQEMHVIVTQICKLISHESLIMHALDREIIFQIFKEEDLESLRFSCLLFFLLRSNLEPVT